MDERFTYLVVKFAEHDPWGASLCMEILNAGPQKPEFSFIYTLNLMGLDFMENAIRQFKTLTELPVEREGKLYVTGHRNENLCYLSMGKVDSALVELNRLREIDNL